MKKIGLAVLGFIVLASVYYFTAGSKQLTMEMKTHVDAEFASLNPTEKFIEQFFKFKKIEFNDGTYRDILQFYTEQGSWHNSNYNINRKSLADRKFLKIVDDK